MTFVKQLKNDLRPYVISCFHKMKKEQMNNVLLNYFPRISLKN